ncbi:hypothetical protein AG0111_0g10633 [Alternaria gaisen]|uniref:Uncharacterized protein n=1 Tax=Alternaria gaisen TaxID=167740 RepID=A0ACB6FA27_9PLEO|nr:hypothetical protein AG0111_0g10633 [Alternaria gaisen]
MLIDATAAAGVKLVVHLGVYSSGRDHIPHFSWHYMVETYIKASGMAWTKLHPKVILDSLLVTEPSTIEKGSFDVMWGKAALGWGPGKHAGADYGLSPEILTGPQAAEVITQAMGIKIECNVYNSEALKAYVATIPDAETRLYLNSAVQTMRLGESGQMRYQATKRDDFEIVISRPATTLYDWARQNLVLEI